MNGSIKEMIVGYIFNDEMEEIEVQIVNKYIDCSFSDFE